MGFKFTKTEDQDNIEDFTHVDISTESNCLDIYRLASMFKDFLLACGYHKDNINDIISDTDEEIRDDAELVNTENYFENRHPCKITLSACMDGYGDTYWRVDFFKPFVRDVEEEKTIEIFLDQDEIDKL